MWVRVGKGVNEENNWLVMCTTEEIRSDISSDISCVLDWVFCISHYTLACRATCTCQSIHDHVIDFGVLRVILV